METAKVIIRYKDGRMLKGSANDFFAKSSEFDFKEDSSEERTRVEIDDLKAIFFVKELDGNPDYSENKAFSEGETYLGKKVEVTYHDGEVALGTVLAYDPQRPGFLMAPPDEQSNNIKIYVVSSAVKELHFL
jgi:small nuclear ribonucleoprotein (snRNP)-like protein